MREIEVADYESIAWLANAGNRTGAIKILRNKYGFSEAFCNTIIERILHPERPLRQPVQLSLDLDDDDRVTGNITSW